MDTGQATSARQYGDEDGDGTVEIKIQTLDAQSYYLRVYRNMSVLALKDRIASQIGVPVENQRLICRGKVLKDDQRLTAYNVEDGHTLHLVSRQCGRALPSSFLGQERTSEPPSDVVMGSPPNRSGSHVSHSLLMGTISIPGIGESGMPDLNRIISAILGSVGLGNVTPGGSGAGPGGSFAVGVRPSRAQIATGLNDQLLAEIVDTQRPSGSPLGERDENTNGIGSPVQLEAMYGASGSEIISGLGPVHPSDSFQIMQNPVVDTGSLTIMSQYLDRLEQSLSFTEGSSSHTIEGRHDATEVPPGGNQTPEQISESVSRQGKSVSGPTSSECSAASPHHVMDRARRFASVPTGAPAQSRCLPTPSTLGIIVNRVQRLLSGAAGPAISRLAAQLENEGDNGHIMAREEVQRTILHDANMMQQLGALLLEIGRATLTLRLGQSPAESVLNVGLPVFISPYIPNQLLVQLPPPRGVTSGAPAVTPSQVMECSNATNSGHVLTQQHFLTQHRIRTQQHIVNHAENSGEQQGNVESNALLGGVIHGPLMTVSESGAMQVVPVRTLSAAVPVGTYPHPLNDGDTTYQAFIAKFPSHLGFSQHGRPFLMPNSSSRSAGDSTHSSGSARAGASNSSSAPPPSVRAKLHIQTWAPSVIPAMSGSLVQPGPVQAGSSQPVSGTSHCFVQQVDVDPSVAVPNDGLQNGQIGDGLIQGDDETVDSLEPFSNQLASFFQSAHRQPLDQPSSYQPNPESKAALNTAATAAPLIDTQDGYENCREDGVSFDQNRGIQREQPSLGLEIHDGMDGAEGGDNALGFEDVRGNSSNFPSPLPRVSKRADVKKIDKEPEGKVQAEDSPITPVGLGVRGLQPLPGRSQRRKTLSKLELVDVGEISAAGNGILAQRSREQTLTPVAGRNLFQDLVSSWEENSKTLVGNAVEQSPARLVQDLLPFLRSVKSHRNEGVGELVGPSRQEVSPTINDENSCQEANSSAMLRAMIGQFLGSSFKRNLLWQARTSGQNDSSRGIEPSGTELGHDSHPGGPGCSDLDGILQRLLPIVSVLLSAVPASVDQEFPSSTIHTDEGTLRGSSDRAHDSGRWRDILSEEEARSWSETVVADIWRQESMEPQGPFSDVYMRGSRFDKRQKTGQVESEASQRKVENLGLQMDVMSSSTETVTPSSYLGGSNGSEQDDVESLLKSQKDSAKANFLYKG